MDNQSVADLLCTIESLVYDLPGGVDEDADPMDTSPRSMTAHVGGLLLQNVAMLRKELGLDGDA